LKITYEQECGEGQQQTMSVLKTTVQKTRKSSRAKRKRHLLEKVPLTSKIIQSDYLTKRQKRKSTKEGGEVPEIILSAYLSEI
jgi:hypothetical protein